ncbi:MAG: hypothetical protein LUD72_03580, partial [Bacteroidales bacterium]|nr:hypothetical protein [Bacteroidales bacterium]
AGNLGSVKSFPAVIVRDSTIEGYMKRSCKNGGIYGAHYLEAGATKNNSVASVGISYNNNAQWHAFVGYAGSGAAVSSQYKNTDTPFDIYVNPHGVYSSWLDGGVEAVLEAAWACEQFGISSVNTSYGGSAKAVVKQFYKDFYGNSSPDTTKILNGSYA